MPSNMIPQAKYKTELEEKTKQNKTGINIANNNISQGEDKLKRFLFLFLNNFLLQEEIETLKIFWKKVVMNTVHHKMHGL